MMSGSAHLKARDVERDLLPTTAATWPDEFTPPKLTYIRRGNGQPLSQPKEPCQGTYLNAPDLAGWWSLAQARIG